MLREERNFSDKNCFKISKNMLLIVFGQMGVQLLKCLDRIREKKEKLEKENSFKFFSNSFAFKETKIYFQKKNKESGFYYFVKKFLSTYKSSRNDSEILILKKADLEANERYQIIKKDEIFKLKQFTATTIQSHYRAFSARRNFMRKNKVEIERRITPYIIKIQSSFKAHMIAKNIKLYLVFLKVLEQRRLAANMINFNLKNFCKTKKIKEYLIIKRIINTRLEKMKVINQAIRRNYYQKKVKQILNKEKNCYSLTYPFVCKTVRLIVYINFVGHVKEQIYNFEYCKLRKVHVLYIPQSDFKSGNYRVKMIVDEHVTCDGRFPHIEFSDGHYYNIIHFSGSPLESNENTETTNKTNKTNKSYKTNKTNKTNNTPHFSEEKEITESLVNESERNNSSNSETYLKELRNNIRTEFDKDLIENLENKESKSYIEIIKASVLNEEMNGNDSGVVEGNFYNFDINTK